MEAKEAIRRCCNDPRIQWLGLGFIVVRGKKWLDSGCILKTRPSGFAEVLDMRCARRSEGKDT